MTSFEATNSVFDITDGYNRLSVSAPNHWCSRGEVEALNRMRIFLKLKSQTDTEFHVKEVEKKF